MSLIKAISTFGGLTMISRIMGFTRDVFMARFLGASLVADAFFVAFKLPNFFRRLFAEGAFNSAFVPLFVGELGDASKDRFAAAKVFAEESMAVLLFVLMVFTGLMQAFMPWVMLGLAPGFVDDPEKFNLAINFTRATFPYLMLISLVSLMAGVLNGLQKFAAAAAAPIILNLTLIGSLLLFNDNQILTGHHLARAVTVAGLFQFIWLAIALKRAGMALRLRWPRLTPKVRELGRIMLPVAIGAGAVQVNLVIDIILASLLPDGSLSYLFYADRLNQLPLGVIGVALGTVLLSSLSSSIAAGDLAKARSDQNRALEFGLLLTLPAATALVVMPEALIGTLFERGAFSHVDTIQTAKALGAYALGLPAYVAIKVLAPAFFARKDTKTPVKIGMIALVINLVFNLILMGPFFHVGLAMATAISAWANAGMLYFMLKRSEYFTFDTRLKSRAFGMIMASGGMAAVIYYLNQVYLMDFFGDLSARVSSLGIIIAAGIFSYGVLTFVFGALKRDDLHLRFGRGR